MYAHPFVLVDRDRAKQFALLQRKRRLFRNYNVIQDDQRVVWASACVDRHCFGVSLLGPGWVFDPYARQQWSERFDDRQREIEAQNAEQRSRQLADVVARLRLGDIAHRVLWATHARVMQSRRSVVRISERRLARCVWGSESPPKNWRETLGEVIAGLTWLHVARQPEEGAPAFEQETTLLTHAANLKGSANDRCDDDCPDFGGAPHAHYLFNIGRGFLGCLEQFGTADDNTGVRTYEFKVRGKKNQGPTLRIVGKTGRLVSVYLPAKLGDPNQCSTLNAQKHDLLQVIVRETTRNTKAKRTDISEAEVFIDNSIPAVQGKKKITCQLLESTGRYVGFNGNGTRRGLGYGLLTPGG